MDERTLLDRMRQALPEEVRGEWSDDAAIIRASWLDPLFEMVLTQDCLVEGVDFRFPAYTPEQVGHKALAVNLSDLAAKGATPMIALVTVACPAESASTLLPALYRGLGALADRVRVTINGGDLSASPGPLMIDCMLMGLVQRDTAWRRWDGKAGDLLWISRPVGWARLGLQLLEHPERGHEVAEMIRALAIELQQTPEPELELSLALRKAGYRGACMDVSDGLVRDVPRLAEASGCGALIAPALLPIAPEFVTLARALEVDPIETALLGGEDFALLGACDPALFEQVNRELEAAGEAPLVQIGWLRPASEGLGLKSLTGELPWPEGGFDHFAGTAS